MDEFETELRARWGAALRYFPAVDSTQRAAWEAARAGTAEGTLFVADTQTAGRGRHGHTWASPPGAGVYASLLLRPRRPPAALLWLTLAAGLALADAVHAVCGVEAQIRWPNDLLIAGKKFGGILVESSPTDHATNCNLDRSMVAVLGFGLNLRPASLPPSLAAIATALDLHTPAPATRGALANAAMEHLLHRYAVWSEGGDDRLRDEFERRSSYARGMPVIVAGSWGGVTDGLDADGFLRVRTPSGVVRTVISGDVRPATES